MKKMYQFRSLRARLIFWFLTITLLSVAITVAVLYFQRSSIIQGREFDKLQVVRDLKVEILNQWLGEREGDIEVFSRDREIRSLNRTLSKPLSEWTPEEVAKSETARGMMRRRVESYEAYHEVFIIEANSGRVVMSSIPSREGQDKRAYPYFIVPMATKDNFTQDIYDSKTERQPAMAFSAPIFCEAHDGEHIIGVIVARADLEHVLYPLLQDRTGEGDTGETLVINKHGYAVNELRWHANAPLNLKIAAEPATRAVAGETGVVETMDYRGEMVLAAFTHIPSMEWGFVIKRDLFEIYTPIREMLGDMILIMILTTLIVLIVSLLLARTIARPILANRDTIMRFAKGDMDARCRVDGADEVAALGTSFNKTADSLASSILIRDGTVGIARSMASTQDLASYARELLQELVKCTHSNMAGFYVSKDEDIDSLEHIASIGLKSALLEPFSVQMFEGEFGQALVTGGVSRIRNIPQDTIFTLRTVVGDTVPREIITIPLIVKEQVRAVISLGSVVGYTNNAIEIVEQALPGMIVGLSSALTAQKTVDLAKELQASNDETQAINEELQEQTEELQAQAIELETQRLQVVEATRLKSEFLSNMSHELRTPLNSVMALSQLMMSRGIGKKPEEDTEHLRVIERNGQILLNLINDILDLSKIEAGGLEIECFDFEPIGLVEQVLGTVRPLVDKKGLKLEETYAELPRMYSDEARIRQILMNLLSNSTKFTDDGHIGIEVSAAGEFISFAIMDTGIGISEEDLAHIFEEFRQVDGSSTRRYQGTGLGLAICQKLAQQLGGEIIVESVLGEGSTFTLLLPVIFRGVPANSDTPTTLEITSKERPSRLRWRPRDPLHDIPLILLVEDNDVAAFQVRNMLEESGYRVIVAKDGATGLNAVSVEIPDAIVLDLMMPDIDGFQVLEQLRSEEETKDIPIAILTAKELTREDRGRLSRNNIHELIQKGNVDREKLLACVANMLEGPSSPDSDPIKPDPVKPIIAEAPVQDSDRNKVILVVEDNPDNMLIIKAILDEMGKQYITAVDGEQAVETARRSRPGLILMDIQLPVMSGIEATIILKGDPELKDTPIVALTARAMKGDKEEILAAGCDDYLSKPLDTEKLMGVVNKWLGSEGGGS